MPHIFPCPPWEERVDEHGNMYINFKLNEAPVIIAHEIAHFKQRQLPNFPRNPTVMQIVTEEMEAWMDALSHTDSRRYRNLATRALWSYIIATGNKYGKNSLEYKEAVNIMRIFLNWLDTKPLSRRQ